MTIPARLPRSSTFVGYGRRILLEAELSVQSSIRMLADNTPRVRHMVAPLAGLRRSPRAPDGAASAAHEAGAAATYTHADTVDVVVVVAANAATDATAAVLIVATATAATAAVDATAAAATAARDVPSCICKHAIRPPPRRHRQSEPVDWCSMASINA